jgi:hypothetical protein
VDRTSPKRCAPSPFVRMGPTPAVGPWARLRPQPLSRQRALRAELRRPLQEALVGRCRLIRRRRSRLAHRQQGHELPRHPRRRALGLNPRAVHQAHSWCNSPRKRRRPKRRPLSAICKQNSPMSSAERIRSYGGPIWAPKGCSTEPWWGRSLPCKQPTSSVRATRPPVAIAWSRTTEFPLTTAICAG